MQETGKQAQINFSKGSSAASLDTGRSARRSLRIALWMGAMIFQALCGFFVAKIPVRPELANVSALFVVIFALPTYHAVLCWLGRRIGLRLLIVLGVYALVVESVALLTGWPYGEFIYSERIGSRVFGLAPWTVPFAWTPLVGAGVMLARCQFASKWAVILAGGALLVALDLVLDPGAVAQGFWKFTAPGDFYNVPLQNFGGWMLSGSVAIALCWWLAPRLRNEAPPAQWLGSCLLILSFWSSACAWMNLWMPALIGFVLLFLMARLFFRDCFEFPLPAQRLGGVPSGPSRD
jgi:putative membrane protein